MNFSGQGVDMFKVDSVETDSLNVVDGHLTILPVQHQSTDLVIGYYRFMKETLCSRRSPDRRTSATSEHRSGDRLLRWRSVATDL